MRAPHKITAKSGNDALVIPCSAGHAIDSRMTQDVTKTYWRNKRQMPPQTDKYNL